jgi:amino acid transporter
MYIISSAYSIHKKIPFSVYGENLIILAQNIMIVLLFWAYSKSVSAIEKLAVFTFFAAFCFVLFSDTMVTEKHWELLT